MRYLLILALTLALVACGKPSSDQNTSPQEKSPEYTPPLLIYRGSEVLFFNSEGLLSTDAIGFPASAYEYTFTAEVACSSDRYRRDIAYRNTTKSSNGKISVASLYNNDPAIGKWNHFWVQVYEKPMQVFMACQLKILLDWGNDTLVYNFPSITISVVMPIRF